MAPEAMELLRRYPWPGNVRELQSVVKQALLHGAGAVLLPDFLPASLRGQASPADDEAAAGSLTAFVQEQLRAGTTTLYGDFQAMTERLLFTEVLRHTGGNQSQAARLLGITRGTLRTRLAALGISIDRSPDDPG